jgi:hypothetical protein
MEMFFCRKEVGKMNKKQLRNEMLSVLKNMPKNERLGI